MTSRNNPTNITVVHCQKEIGTKSNRYKISFDNGVSCRVYGGDVRQFGLIEGNELSFEVYRELMEDVLAKRAKKRALHLLERMEQTQWQLRTKLEKAGYPSECIEDALAYVQSYHYVDDSRFASNFVRISQEKMSKGNISRKLLSKGVDREIVKQALEEYESDELQQICKLLEKRGFQKETAYRRELQRTYAFLARRGFCNSDILKALSLDISVEKV